VIVQGFGNVGSAIAAKLSAAGARIVGASDVTCGLYNAKGLDMVELSAARLRPYGLSGYQGATDTHLVPETLDKLLELPCEILVPAARPDIIRETNAGRITARLILQGANNPVRPSCEGQLHRRRIANLSDFIVNAGGVIAGAVELKADKDPKFDRQVRSDGASGRMFLEKLVSRVIADNVAEVFIRQKRSGSNILWKAAAMQLAKERLTSGRSQVLPELEHRQ
jgi:glutamate dehydrogenase/leucine dehydrogenase